MLRRAFVDLVLQPSTEQLRLYVDFYLSSVAALLTGTISIHEPLYAYRMHGANKHSNGVVFGGEYNSSKRRWEPVRESVFACIADTLERNAAEIQMAFGAQRLNWAQEQVRHALKGSKSHGLLRSGQARFQPLLSCLNMVKSLWRSSCSR